MVDYKAHLPERGLVITEQSASAMVLIFSIIELFGALYGTFNAESTFERILVCL